ncbi:MAG: helix-turn-helix domain-containing protein [Oscillospiraceae bacterium]|nr:helix-turn-helix domain-containing protein [Oscillospiraceae bacterium]
MFYKTLKELCLKNETNVTQLCNDLGLSSANTGNWKRGSHPKIGTLNLIAERFGVSVEYLLTGEEPETAPASDGCAALSDNEAELLEMYAQLDKLEQTDVKGYIARLVRAKRVVATASSKELAV